jgi:beta-phosphoglucomutase-like phosphatase (HAD superfamily)
VITPGIVFEDAPSGIRSGRAAGCKVIALLTTHTREQVEAAQPDFIVKDLSWRVFQPYNAQAYSTELSLV